MVVSFALMKLISTLSKRQRKFRELVNALEEDGPELDYNLKPLFSNRTLPVKPGVSSEDNRPAPKDSDDDREFIKNIEEITSTPTYEANDANGKNKVFNLSLSNLKVDKVALNTREPNIPPLKVGDVVEEDIDNNPARHNLGIGGNTGNENEIVEEAFPHSISAEAETVAREFSDTESETQKEDETVNTEEPPNSDSSIWVEIESVISEF